MTKATKQLTVKDMDDLDAAILNNLQNHFPILERPFAAIAKTVGLEEDEVLQRIRGFKEGKVIRQISPIFDTKSLGYKSSLVAARYPEEKLDEAAEMINGHPGVSHNYRRNHFFNLWYTLAIPPTSELGLEGTCDVLHNMSGAEATRILPTLKLFKIGVDLDASGKRSASARGKAAYTDKSRGKAGPLSEEETRIISESQWDMEVISTPWQKPADAAGVEVERLLEVLRDLKTRGAMRRVAAVLFHRKMGYSANAMGVWAIPEERADEVGSIMASFRSVSHCYLRPTYEDWPYNVFSMVHGKSKDECEEVLDSIAKEIGISERTSLYSTKEYKKTRVQYFTPAMAEWDAANRHFLRE
jgi:DNA-binding Lrp family transcriptional regulator